MTIIMFFIVSNSDEGFLGLRLEYLLKSEENIEELSDLNIEDYTN